MDMDMGDAAPMGWPHRALKSLTKVVLTYLQKDPRLTVRDGNGERTCGGPSALCVRPHIPFCTLKYQTQSTIVHRQSNSVRRASEVACVRCRWPPARWRCGGHSTHAIRLSRDERDIWICIFAARLSHARTSPRGPDVRPDPYRATPDHTGAVETNTMSESARSRQVPYTAPCQFIVSSRQRATRHDHRQRVLQSKVWPRRV